jgi:hypothetical protein
VVEEALTEQGLLMVELEVEELVVLDKTIQVPQQQDYQLQLKVIQLQ